jgi:3',5'-cyclic-AMP phosphodiesterase
MAQHRLTWLHVGDVHPRADDGRLGVDRLARVLGELSPRLDAGAVDFIYLPGDDASEGQGEQYSRLADVLAGVRLAPLHVIAGDHDYASGELNAFGAFLRALDVDAPPRRVDIKGRRVLLLEVVPAGGGGPEFDLGRAQTVWLDRQLDAARREDAYPPVVLMHTFPGDLAYDGAGLAERFARARVSLVDTSHTHYTAIAPVLRPACANAGEGDGRSRRVEAHA